jgi:hypothetical protein
MFKTKKMNWMPQEMPVPFEDDLFAELWVKLLSMPKWRRKPISAIELAVNKLRRYEMDFAADLIENAIIGEYQGVVFPDTPRKYEIWKQQKNNQNGAKQANATFTRETVNTEFNNRNYNNR